MAAASSTPQVTPPAPQGRPRLRVADPDDKPDLHAAGNARYEVQAIGLDEQLQGLTSDPWGAQFPMATGLRIPPVLPGSTPQTQPRYLFVLDSVVPTTRTVLRGMRQGLTLGGNFGTGGTFIVEKEVQTPSFKFPDGNVSWHLVLEQNRRRVGTRPLTETLSFAYHEADSPSMLFETYANSTGTPPPFYMVGMTAYTPPVLYPDWKPIGNLGTFYDLRFPWRDSHAQRDLNVVIDADCRISLYASVLQTNPATRPTISGANAAALGLAGAGEAAFVGAGDAIGAAVMYWRIFGALVFDDADAQLPR